MNTPFVAVTVPGVRLRPGHPIPQLHLLDRADQRAKEQRGPAVHQRALQPHRLPEPGCRRQHLPDHRR